MKRKTVILIAVIAFALTAFLTIHTLRAHSVSAAQPEQSAQPCQINCRSRPR